MMKCELLVKKGTSKFQFYLFALFFMRQRKWIVGSESSCWSFGKQKKDHG